DLPIIVDCLSTKDATNQFHTFSQSTGRIRSANFHLALNPHLETWANPQQRTSARYVIQGAEFHRRQKWMPRIRIQHPDPDFQGSRVARNGRREREGSMIEIIFWKPEGTKT